MKRFELNNNENKIKFLIIIEIFIEYTLEYTSLEMSNIFYYNNINSPFSFSFLGFFI